MSDTADIRDLLQHATWMRRLAMCLVRDEAAADELMQETWVAAMRHPPRVGQTVRPWLGEVLRNVMRAKFRSDTRRGRRETAAGQPDAETASAEQLYERAELQRTLAGELLALDEPYRATLLLHFYEGLAPTEIANRLSQPAGTIRWRLKAGLEQLRARFDRKYRGDRNAWLSAIAPIAVPKTPVVTSTLIGGLAMKLGAAVIITMGAATALTVFKHRTHAQPVVAHVEPFAPPTTIASPPPSTTTRLEPKLAHAAADTRAKMLQRISNARQAASAPAKTAPLDDKYVSAQMRALAPLFKECVAAALGRKAKVKGTIVVRFTIVGDPSVGGLVGESSIIDDESTIDDKELRECLAETMYAAKFPPPPEEGSDVTIDFPFTIEIQHAD